MFRHAHDQVKCYTTNRDLVGVAFVGRRARARASIGQAGPGRTGFRPAGGPRRCEVRYLGH